MYFHTFVLWASDWGWIEQTLNSRRSPHETEVFLLHGEYQTEVNCCLCYLQVGKYH
jgi:hypothetical protein